MQPDFNRVDIKIKTDRQYCVQMYLMKYGKVGLSRDVNWKVFYYAMALNNAVLSTPRRC